jgi:Tfp pilus assembly protein PilZ
MNSRAPINIPVNLTSVKRKNMGTLHNVSETGAFIHSYDNLKPEDKISLRFMLSEKNSGLSVDGKVVRVDGNAEKKSFYNGFGIHFTKTSPAVKTLIASVVNRKKEVDRIW